jgi:hypothetical protein
VIMRAGTHDAPFGIKIFYITNGPWPVLPGPACRPGGANPRIHRVTGQLRRFCDLHTANIK